MNRRKSIETLVSNGYEEAIRQYWEDIMERLANGETVELPIGTAKVEITKPVATVLTGKNKTAGSFPKRRFKFAMSHHFKAMLKERMKKA